MRTVFLLLLISSFCFAAGCTFARYGNLRENGTIQFAVEKHKPFALKPNDKMMFKSSIDVYGRHFSGIMFVKTIGERHYRIVFLTEVGLGIFNFELNHGVFTDHGSVEMIKDERILTTLQEDLKLILLEADSSAVAERFNDSSSGNAVYRVSSGDGYNYYYFDVSDRIRRIEHSTSCFKKVAVDFTDANGEIPASVNVTHYNINLTMHFVEMKRLSEND